MKNIHLLPTEKPSRILFDMEENYYLPIQEEDVRMDYQDLVQNRHIYITSDEETSPKKGDWYLGHPNYISIHRWHTDVSKIDGRNVFLNKIILTTDQELFKDGVQPIDDDFLEWMVKNPSCEFVEVEEFDVKVDLLEYKTKYKIIIPQEEPDPIMDEFDKTLKMLHESTHDVKIRESILLVQRYKTEYLDNTKQR